MAAQTAASWALTKAGLRVACSVVPMVWKKAGLRAGCWAGESAHYLVARRAESWAWNSVDEWAPN